MRRTTKLYLLAGVLLAMAGTAWAQAEREINTGFYRLDFVTKELDDTKVINSRTYSLIVSDKSGGNSMRSSSKVAIPTGHGDQYQFYDIGVNLDVKEVREVQGQLSVGVAAGITHVAADSTPNSSLPPVMRSYNWNSVVLVPLRKATQIFSSDDLGSKRKFQLELTATPVK